MWDNYFMKIFVKAKPGSKEEKIEKISDNSFIVWVKEPPIKGLANQAITRTLAVYFNASPSRVELVSGFSSKHKLFEISD